MTTVKPPAAGRPPAVDKRLLSADEYEQYQTFSRRWDRGPTFRELPALAVVNAIFGVVVVGGVVAAFLWADGQPTEQENRMTGLGCALCIAGLVPYVWFTVRSRRRWWIKLEAEAEAFLRERIKGAPPSDARDDDPGNPYWWTGNYDPQRYHRSFRGMTREDRDYVSNAYEDLDTYESNRPD